MSLSIVQVREIETILENRGIKYQAVRLELLDHLACEIEDLIAQGHTFHTAFAKIKSVYTGQFLSDYIKTKEKEMLKEWTRIYRSETFKFYRPPVLLAMIAVNLLVFYLLIYNDLLLKMIAGFYIFTFIILMIIIIKISWKNYHRRNKYLCVSTYLGMLATGMLIYQMPLNLFNLFGWENNIWYAGFLSMVLIWAILQAYVTIKILPQKLESIYHVKMIS